MADESQGDAAIPTVADPTTPEIEPPPLPVPLPPAPWAPEGTARFFQAGRVVLLPLEVAGGSTGAFIPDYEPPAAPTPIPVPAAAMGGEFRWTREDGGECAVQPVYVMPLKAWASCPYRGDDQWASLVVDGLVVVARNPFG